PEPALRLRHHRLRPRARELPQLSRSRRAGPLEPAGPDDRRGPGGPMARLPLDRRGAAHARRLPAGPDSVRPSGGMRVSRDSAQPLLPPLPRAVVGEAVGTFLLVLFGTGSVASAILTGALTGLWQVAVVWGFGVTLAIYASATLSGAHLNPAVS